VQSVPAPVGLRGRRRPLASAALALALAALVAMAAIGLALSRPEPRVVAQPGPKPASYNALIGGVQLQSARCMHWNGGTAAERDKVAGALAYSVGGGTPYGPGTTLSSGEAHALFDRACASSIAQNWLLYELYIRAAGFHSYTPR
jgi:hypothetical protein